MSAAEYSASDKPAVRPMPGATLLFRLFLSCHPTKVPPADGSKPKSVLRARVRLDGAAVLTTKMGTPASRAA